MHRARAALYRRQRPRRTRNRSAGARRGRPTDAESLSSTRIERLALEYAQYAEIRRTFTLNEPLVSDVRPPATAKKML